ncbi:uncharacterized protein K460DRAFT_360574 [Cucurbitaria berberidis CBS 394.84]|uniref:Uncharacterized protein n=1 Tax=Cucurbitaria berberidis CBS 394.84 TaxID=1168544 RepID=A0A9P4GQV4_9PLEO|nr:uncharacterized protein K460DRAFT_360574 [Cucurbitaria berberidis CBS 394.84]KAF1849721.1 hypothetical protein K460DRAFT_360574 [Cucurbitaria berberidis CBS 394.84]
MRLSTHYLPPTHHDSGGSRPDRETFHSRADAGALSVSRRTTSISSRSRVFVFSSWYQSLATSVLSRDRGRHIASSPGVQNPPSNIHRADSAISLSPYVYPEEDDIPKRNESPQKPCQIPDSLLVHFQFEDRIYNKQLNYSAFSKWDSVDALLVDLEKDGVLVVQLWDVREEMPICSGDWNARVRPGWEVLVTCVDGTLWGDEGSECGDINSADDEDDYYYYDHHARERLDDFVAYEGLEASIKHWWFTRWRQRVERASLADEESGLDLSWSMILLGGVSLAAVLGLVILFAVWDMRSAGAFSLSRSSSP